jgi:RNA polymerase sigma-70 factor (ECF subfamily)
MLLSTTEALRRLALGRDGDAWSAILQRHGAAVLGLAQRITGDRALCEDVCQETLLQIRAHAGSFAPPAVVRDAEAAAKGWVMSIAYRTAIHMLRVRSRRIRNEAHAGRRQLSQLPTERDPLLTAEQRALLRGEVARLPELLRIAVCLHFYGNLSYSELGVSLGCNEKAARKRVERGVQKLRARLAGEGLAFGAVALVSVLGGSSHAATGAAFVAAPQISNTLSLARLAEWQALLHHPAAPVLTGIAKIGATVIMAKYIVTIAALLAFALSGVQAYRTSSLTDQLTAARDQAADLQERVDTLEKLLNENRGETAALKSNVQTHNSILAQSEQKPAQRIDQPDGIQGFNQPLVAGNEFKRYTAALNKPHGDVSAYFEQLKAQQVDGAVVQQTPQDIRTTALDALNRKLNPDTAPRIKNSNMLVKLLDANTIQYESLDGKVIQTFCAPNELPPFPAPNVDPFNKAPGDAALPAIPPPEKNTTPARKE